MTRRVDRLPDLLSGKFTSEPILGPDDTAIRIYVAPTGGDAERASYGSTFGATMLGLAQRGLRIPRWTVHAYDQSPPYERFKRRFRSEQDALTAARELANNIKTHGRQALDAWH